MLLSFNGGAGAFPGMGAELFAGEPVFRAVVERAAPVVQEISGYDVLPSFAERVPPPSKEDRRVLLGLLQLGHVELWRASGVEADAVIGLSQGEIGAVYAAGGLSLEDAAHVLAALCEGLRDGREPHVMFLIEADRSAASALCEESPVPLAVGGTLSLDITTLLCAAGDAPAAAEHVEARHRVIHSGVSARATHTALASPTAATIDRHLGGIAPRPTIRACFLASLGGELPSGAVCDARHWRYLADRNFLYGEAADAALAIRPSIIVQIGADPHTSPYLERAARRHAVAPRLVETMIPGEPELATWQRARNAVGQSRVDG